MKDDVEMVSEDLKRNPLISEEQLNQLKESYSYANNEISNYKLSILKIGG